MTTTTIDIPPIQIQLAAGERYAGLMLGADGAPSHHLVLLPGNTKAAWDAAKAWAA
jgi:hypothetical protein